MPNRQLRQNVRNLMVPMTVAEAQITRDGLLAKGHTEAAGYADEFILELEADFAGCDENAETPGPWN